VLSGQFDRDPADSQNRETLGAFGFHLDELESRLTELRAGDRGADWVHKNTRPLLSIGRGCPDAVVRKLEGMVRSRNPEVTIERRATDEEVQEIEVREARSVRRPHYISDPVGRVSGLEALYPENDLRELLVIDLQKPIDEFRELSIPSLTHMELRRWAKWVATIDDTLERATTAVASGRLLLSAAGLEPLLRSLQQADQTQFRAFIRSLKTYQC
jgi:hypothetical protein